MTGVDVELRAPATVAHTRALRRAGAGATFLSRARHVVHRAIGWLRARRLVLSGAHLHGLVLVDGTVRVDAQGRVEIGDHTLFLDGPVATELIAHESATLALGASVIVNYGASIEAWSRVIVGKNTMFGSFARVTDRDFGREGPVVIEDDVWIAHGAYVGPGVTIGRGAVVAAGAVVMSDVPPQRLAIGNPARAVPLELVDKSPS